MGEALTVAATAFSAVIAGVAIGLRISAWQLSRAKERNRYAAQELTRRKVGALEANLRDKRGEL